MYWHCLMNMFQPPSPCQWCPKNSTVKSVKHFFLQKICSAIPASACCYPSMYRCRPHGVIFSQQIYVAFLLVPPVSARTPFSLLYHLSSYLSFVIFWFQHNHALIRLSTCYFLLVFSLLSAGSSTYDSTISSTPSKLFMCQQLKRILKSQCHLVRCMSRWVKENHSWQNVAFL